MLVRLVKKIATEKKLPQKVLLILDNYPSHSGEEDLNLRQPGFSRQRQIDIKSHLQISWREKHFLFKRRKMFQIMNGAFGTRIGVFHFDAKSCDIDSPVPYEPAKTSPSIALSQRQRG
ncbi:hypothetical protein NPIL_103411 [Nephila pilipes]|uniref:Uncharacterized protein n=1 Tax=Nephila pilipes TaxID=299642 RepID=A0A8X6PJV7_NEPPI|nr:hypothetical protein NPIL_103411 [Nephila pilipes]